MNQDFRDILDALLASEARFLVVGAHALAAHGLPRFTRDLDIWVEACSLFNLSTEASRTFQDPEEFRAKYRDLVLQNVP